MCPAEAARCFGESLAFDFARSILPKPFIGVSSGLVVVQASTYPVLLVLLRAHAT